MECTNNLLARQTPVKHVGLVKCSFFRAEAIVNSAFRKWTLVFVLHAIVCARVKKSFVSRMNANVVAVNVSRVGMHMKRECEKSNRKIEGSVSYF
jgi:hypothetical protein